MAKAAKKTITKATTKNVLTVPRPASSTASASLTVGDIAKRAFELYCERGHQDGHDLQDWIQAERELRDRVSSSAA